VNAGRTGAIAPVDSNSTSPRHETALDDFIDPLQGQGPPGRTTAASTPDRPAGAGGAPSLVRRGQVARGPLF